MMVLEVVSKSLSHLRWIGYANNSTACELIRNGITDVMSAKKNRDEEGSVFYTIGDFWFYSVVDDSFKLEDLQAEMEKILENNGQGK